MSYLLDTNQISKAVKPHSLVRQRIILARRAGNKVGTCMPVLCELATGIVQVRDPIAYRASLVRLLQEVRVWPIDFSTTELYGQLFHELRQQGRVLSQVDMMVAALARRMKLTVVSSDRDFQAVSKLSVVDWSI